jgi:hypothetical protein
VRVEAALERAGRWVVEGSLVLFAAWTVVYQAALVLGIGSTLTLLLALALGAGGLVLLHRSRRSAWGEQVAAPGLRVTLVVVAATVTATALGLAGLRGPALGAAVVGAALGLGAAARRAWRAGGSGLRSATNGGGERDADVERGLRAEVDTAHPAQADTAHPAQADTAHPAQMDTGQPGDPTTPRWLWPLGWAAGLASGVLASILSRPDGDDAYFVNLSTWVAERGNFPLRDTMISPNVFPANQAHSPPVHSIEGLVGAVARIADVEAGTATYVLLPPMATVLAVLVLTRVVQEARIPAAPLALAAVVGYLWTTGGSGYSLGNFFAVRIWQGKALLVALVLPLVLLFGARLIRRGTPLHHMLFGSALVAGVGMSNTAVFLLPVLVAGLVLAAAALREVRGGLRLVLWVLYPAAVALVTLALAPSSPSASQLGAEGFAARASRTADPLLTVPGRNGIVVVTALAIGIGALGLRERTLRTAALGAVATGGVALLPPVRSLLDAAGLSSVLWRMWWVLPIALLIAGLVGAAAGRMPPGRRTLVAAPVALAVALVPLVGGTWVGSPANARVVEPTTWKVPPGALREARFVESVSRPGDTVLVPWDTSRVLAALTVDVQPVSARRSYLPTYAATPGALAGSREELQQFVDERTPDTNTIGDELAALSVDTACVGTARGRAVELLEANGFEVVGTVNTLTCLRR